MNTAFVVKEKLVKQHSLIHNLAIFSSRVRAPEGDNHTFALPRAPHTKHHQAFH